MAFQPEQDIRALLRQMIVAEDLDDSAVESLAKIAQLETYAEGTVLFSEGEQHGQMYFVVGGSITLNMMTAKFGRQTILSVGSRDLMAWSALLGDQIMTSTAIAVEEATCIVFHADSLRKLLEQESMLGYRVMTVVAKAMSRRLVATRLQLLDLYHP